jgi:predicted membrane protein DUF2157
MPEEPANRQSAQRRADRISAFREELAELEREEALRLTPEQRDRLNHHLDLVLSRLRAQFDVDVAVAEKQISWGMRIAVTLGGLALCAGLVLFFYRFWGELATAAQVAILIPAPLVALAVTDFAARREKTLYFAALAAMVALALFILNLYALGSIFNITPSPNAFAAWSVFALAIAYQYGLRLLLIAGLVSGGIWTAATAVALGGAYWDGFLQRPECQLVVGTVLFMLALTLPHRRNGDFPVVYRATGLIAAFVALLWLAGEGSSSFFGWPARVVERSYEALGWAATIAAMWLGIRRQWQSDVNLAAAFFAIFLFVRLYRWWWDWMPRYLFFLAVGVIAIGLVAGFQRLRRRAGEAAA